MPPVNLDVAGSLQTKMLLGLTDKPFTWPVKSHLPNHIYASIHNSTWLPAKIKSCPHVRPNSCLVPFEGFLFTVGIVDSELIPMLPTYIHVPLLHWPYTFRQSVNWGQCIGRRVSDYTNIFPGVQPCQPWEQFVCLLLINLNYLQKQQRCPSPCPVLAKTVSQCIKITCLLMFFSFSFSADLVGLALL